MIGRNKVTLFVVVVLVASLLPLAFACAPAAAPVSKVPTSVTYWTIGDLSGPYATIMVPLYPALEDACEYANTKLGGIKGVPLKYEVRDNGGKMDTTLAQYEQIRTTTPKPIIMSGWVATQNEALKDRFAEDKIPYICSPSAAALYPPAYSFGWDASYADEFGGDMQWLKQDWKESRPPKVAILTWDTGLGKGCTTPETYAYAKAMGIDIVATEYFPMTKMDVSTELLRIKDKNPDYIYTGTLSFGPVAILKAAAAMGYKIKLMGMYGLGWDSIALGGAPLFEGVITARSLASWDDVDYAPVKQMIAIADAKNREKKIRDTVYAITMTYVTVGREVISRAVDEVGWDKLNGEAVYNQLVKLKNFAPLGGLNFYNYSPEIRSTRQGYIAEIRDGKILPITKWHEFPDLRVGGPYTPK